MFAICRYQYNNSLSIRVVRLSAYERKRLPFADTYLDSDQRVALRGRLVGYVEHSCLIIVLRKPVKPTEG